MLKEIIAKENKKISRLCENVRGLSYSAFRKALREKDVKVNGRRTDKDETVQIGDKIEIYYKPVETEKYSVIYSDENVVVTDKKQGYTSEEVFEDILSKNKGAKFIHRLDRNTGGIMIFALNENAEKELLAGFKNRAFNKIYKAKVFGSPKKNADTLTAYLLKDEKTSTVRIFSEKASGSVEIKTGYKVIKKDTETTDLEVYLYTGKTHQIRAHLAFIGCPIVGDGKYGDNEKNKKAKVKYQMLTAYKLTLFFGEQSVLKYLNGKTFTVE